MYVVFLSSLPLSPFLLPLFLRSPLSHLHPFSRHPLRLRLRLHQDIQLWSFESSEPHLIRHLSGHTQSKFYVRSCFAGPNDNLVISGSEGEPFSLHLSPSKPFSSSSKMKTSLTRPSLPPSSVRFRRLQRLRLAPPNRRTPRGTLGTYARSRQRCGLEAGCRWGGWSDVRELWR